MSSLTFATISSTTSARAQPAPIAKRRSHGASQRGRTASSDRTPSRRETACSFCTRDGVLRHIRERQLAGDAGSRSFSRGASRGACRRRPATCRGRSRVGRFPAAATSPPTGRRPLRGETASTLDSNGSGALTLPGCRRLTAAAICGGRASKILVARRIGERVRAVGHLGLGERQLLREDLLPHPRRLRVRREPQRPQRSLKRRLSRWRSRGEPGVDLLVVDVDAPRARPPRAASGS